MGKTSSGKFLEEQEVAKPKSGFSESEFDSDAEDEMLRLEDNKGYGMRMAARRRLEQMREERELQAWIDGNYEWD